MKPKKSKIAKKIATSFSRLSRAEKRMTIAKDVIAQIKRGKYIAEKGTYISDITTPKLEDSWGSKVEGFEEKDVQKNFSKIQSCTVCALGACLMSSTKFANQLVFEDVDSVDADSMVKNEKVNKLFKSLFSPEQLFLIEEAFEGDNEGCSSRVGKMMGARVPKKLLKKSVKFFDESGEDEHRLISIMKNIIKNKGTFKP
jgi:hypothetical protein